MKTKITSANWLEIAEAYGTPFEERTERQGDIAGHPTTEYRYHLSLCGTINNNFNINIYDQMEMMARSMNIYRAYWWPCDSAYDQSRSDFALLMWAIGTRGFNDLLKYAEGYDGDD